MCAFPPPPPPPTPATDMKAKNHASNRKRWALALSVIFIILVASTLIYYHNSIFDSTPAPSATPTNATISTPSPSAIATPVPTTGTVQGQLIGYITQKPIAGATVFLCPITGPNECQVQTSNSVISQSDGNFTFTNVAPGSYAIVLGLAGEFKVTTQSVDGKNIRFTDDSTLMDTFTNTGLTYSTNKVGSGLKISSAVGLVFDGAVVADDTGLRMEFRNSDQSIFGVTVGNTTMITFTVTEDLSDNTWAIDYTK